MSQISPVVIVGGGPVGLTMGLILARWGVANVILESEGRRSAGSRAICIQRHTLEIFDALGAARPMLEKGVTWRLGRVFFRGREIFQIRLGGDDAGGLPPFINLQQDYTEEFLGSAVDAEPLSSLRRKHRVTGIAATGAGVQLRVETPNGEREMEAGWVLAADGARSTVRQSLGIPFEGRTHGSRFLIVDVRSRLDFPNERRFWFDPVFNRGRSALLHPQPDGVWRIDWQLGPDADPEVELHAESVARRVREVIGDRPFEVAWKSLYTFHQRCAKRFRLGSVFLLGDAAHLMSPFGARGMNSGVQDAWNLGWKLALVLQGLAAESLLDSYELERRPAALENLRITAGSMDFIAPESRGRRLMRNCILGGSLYFPALRKHVNSGRLSSPSVYRDSPVILPDEVDGSPLAGSLAPAAAEPFPNRMGFGFLVLYFGGPERAADLRAILASGPRLPVTVCLVTRDRPPANGAPIFWDERGELWAAYAAREGTVCVIRPDGHIAARCDRLQLEELPGLLARAAGVSLC